jgi:hypothetical protein
MKRRQFTTSVATIAALSALFGQAAFAALKLAPEQLMARDRFESLLGQQFTIWGNAADTRLRLTSVKSAIRGHDEEQFNVMFDAPEGPVLPEGIYVLEAGGKTEFGLHLLPGGTMSGRQQMIASVNLQTAA